MSAMNVERRFPNMLGSWGGNGHEQGMGWGAPSATRGSLTQCLDTGNCFLPGLPQQVVCGALYFRWGPGDRTQGLLTLQMTPVPDQMP